MSITKSLKTLKSLALAGLLAGLAAQASAETHFASVDGFSTARWHTCMNAGETAAVVVDGDGYSDLDLYVYDDNGYRIISDTGPTDHCVGAWTVLRDSCFTIDVVNRGLFFNRYLVTIESR